MTPSPPTPPTPNEADRNFLAYQETASPRYLARVFDLVAGELLLLASHLSRDPHMAEDLVQTTFLEAIRSAKRFEMRSGVKQWLVGILANQARLEWRRRGRMLDPDRLRSEVTQDPDFEVEAREFQEALTEAMAGLPAKYREVLRLALFHDLTSAEIAQALERPRETVKSQVRRGLAMLKKAMPQSLALGALVTMLPGRGLAAMKMAVLAEAEAAHAAATAASVTAAGMDPAGGFGSWVAWGTGKKIAAAALGMVVLGIGAWRLWPEPPGFLELDPSTMAGSRVGEGEGEGEGAVTPAGAGQRSVMKVPESTETDASDKTDHRHGELSVKVRFQSDQAPVPGAAVSLRPVGEETWLRDVVSRTGADGTARFVGLPAGDVQILGGRGGRTQATVLAGRQAEVQLSIPPGMNLRGLVQDKAGKPLGDVPIYLSPPDRGVDFGVEVVRSGMDGRFRIRDVEPSRGILAAAPGRVGPKPCYLRGKVGGDIDVLLQFRGPGARVRGIVRGPEGRPVPGAAVMIGWSCQATDAERLPCYRLRTDAGGAFFAPGVWTLHDLPVWVKGAGASGTAVWRGNVASLQPGAEAFVPVDLKAGARVKGVVRVAGEPLAGVRVEALQDDVEEGPGFKFGGPAWARVRTVSGEDGSFVLPNIRAGGGKLDAADPRRPELGHARRGFQLQDGEELRWNPILTRGPSILGRVVDERGAAIAGFRVKLMGPKHTEDRVLYSADDGTFAFDRLEDIPYTLTMADKDPLIPHLAVFFEGVRPGVKVVDFPIADAARASCHLIGTIVGPDGLPVEGLRLSLIHQLDGTVKAARVRDFAYRHGHFQVGPVPPATYHVYGVASRLGFLYLGRFVVNAAGQTVDVGTAKFQEPAFLAVKVKDPDGGPTAVPSLELRAKGSPAGVPVVLKGGECKQHLLAPGVYWLSHWSYDHVPFFRRLEVGSGQRLALDVQLQKGVGVSFRLPPVPLVGTGLELELYETRGTGTGAKDLRRLLHRQQRIYGHTSKSVANTLSLMPGRYELVVTSLSGRRAVTPFVVTAGTHLQQVDVRFPGGE